MTKRINEDERRFNLACIRVWVRVPGLLGAGNDRNPRVDSRV